MLHTNKINGIIMDLDATACYNRIVVSVGMLACRRLGVPITAIRSHADTLKYLKYYIKTMYGISINSYEGTIFEPLFGTGQGSGASPAIWLAISVILLTSLDNLENNGFKFTDPTKKLTIHHKGAVFVDDK